MKITSDRGTVWFRFVALILATCVFYCAMIVDTSSAELLRIAHIGTLVVAFLVLTDIPNLIADGRTLEMDRDGCTISFGFFGKFYAWECFLNVSLEKYNHGFGNPRIYKECVLFSIPQRKKNTSVRNWLYRHPWTSFTIHSMQDPQKVRWIRGYVRLYEVDMQLFSQKMKEWGVEIEGLIERTGQ